MGGWVDNVMMRFSEMILSFPSLILAMIINAVMGSNLFNTMFALIVVAWPTYARMMRSVVLSVRKNEYVAASEVLGRLQNPDPDEGGHSQQHQFGSDYGYHGHRKPDSDVLHLKLSGTGPAPPTPEWGYDGLGWS